MIQHQVDLTPFNTFGLSVKASTFASFTSREDLDTILNANRSQKLLILGGGSNMLLTQDIDCLVLKNDIKGISIISESSDEVLVKAMSGEVWHDLVLFCIENNFES